MSWQAEGRVGKAQAEKITQSTDQLAQVISRGVHYHHFHDSQRLLMSPSDSRLLQPFPTPAVCVSRCLPVSPVYSQRLQLTKFTPQLNSCKASRASRISRTTSRQSRKAPTPEELLQQQTDAIEAALPHLPAAFQHRLHSEVRGDSENSVPYQQYQRWYLEVPTLVLLVWD